VRRSIILYAITFSILQNQNQRRSHHPLSQSHHPLSLKIKIFNKLVAFLLEFTSHVVDNELPIWERVEVVYSNEY